MQALLWPTGQLSIDCKPTSSRQRNC